ncbi:hypothetical protein C1141_10715 [Vibrio agarivorans]|nr:hypothetical protein C1141_10715 [Vibrio agarivorans]
MWSIGGSTAGMRFTKKYKHNQPMSLFWIVAMRFFWCVWVVLFRRWYARIETEILAIGLSK